MRLHIVRSKNDALLYAIESTYFGHKHAMRIVEKLCTEAQLLEKLDGRDPYKWAKEIYLYADYPNITGYGFP